MRPLRDIEAEAMRRERLGLIRPLWADMDEESREEWRRRADHMDRVRREILAGGASPDPQPDPIIVSCQLVSDPGKERAIRADKGVWSVVLIDRKTGETTLEQSFTLVQADILSGQALNGDPEATKRAGLGRLLAAALNIYRLNAQAMVTE